MGKNTSILWTHSTCNFWLGCSKVFVKDPLTFQLIVELGVCNHCYVERISDAFKRFEFGKINYTNWEKKEKELRNWSPRLIFVEDMGDIMHEAVPDVSRDKVFSILKSVAEEQLAKYGKCHQYQLLTKRPEKLRSYFEKWAQVPPYFWVGVSIGNKPSAYYLRLLKQVPAEIRWVSFEPLVQDITDFDGSYRTLADARYEGVFDSEGLLNLEGISWVVIGGESGKDPRPMSPAWAENIIRAARKYGSAVFFKQMGGKGNDGAGGNILNGKTYKEWPTARTLGGIESIVA